MHIFIGYFSCIMDLTRIYLLYSQIEFQYLDFPNNFLI